MISRSELVENYVKAIQEGYAAIFAGAGLSRSSGYVDWKELINPLARSINLDTNKENDLIAVAQYYRNERGNRAGINQAIMREFTKEVQVNENIKILARLPIETYWTTNYDTLIEDELKNKNKRVEIKVNKENLATTLPDRDVVLYKMHGDVSNPADAVLTKDDYECYDIKRPLFRTALQGDLISKTFMFIGFSFADPNLDYILSRIHILLNENEREHYCFFKKVLRKDCRTDEEYNYLSIRQELREKDLRRYGIQAIFVDEYSEITDILKEIETRILLKNVFISGSIEEYTKWTREEADELSYKIAEKLIENDFKIISGFGLGVGSSVINGALSEIYNSKYRHIDEYLCLRPFPHGIKDVKEREKLYSKYRQAMIGDAGIVLFLFGNKKNDKGISSIAKGCIEEYEIAKKQGKYLIPIGSTGYVAEQILDEIKKNLSSFEYLSEYIDILSDETDINILVNTILNIIKKINSFY